MENEILRAFDWLAAQQISSAKELARHLHSRMLHFRDNSPATGLLRI